jgi:hypothetical protein
MIKKTQSNIIRTFCLVLTLFLSISIISALSPSLQLGGSGFIPTMGDLDNDGKSDAIVYNPNTGEYRYFLSSTQTITTGNLGVVGAKIYTADYNDNGREDIILYKESTGEYAIVYSSGGIETGSLGTSGYTLNFGDYNNDGKTDLVLYKESTGEYAILYKDSSSWITGSLGISGYSIIGIKGYNANGITELVLYKQSTSEYAIFRQGNLIDYGNLGLPGCKAILGKFDGDNIYDLAVYQESTGTWAIRFSTDGSIRTGTFGGPGYHPINGDYNGDGKTDFIIYGAINGNWYTYSLIAPTTAIFVGDSSGAHNDETSSKTIYASLWNDDSVFSITQCQINWGDGSGWKSVSNGGKNKWYIESNTYSSAGLKTISYRCVNNVGLWSSGSVKHTNYDSITILQTPAPTITITSPTSGGTYTSTSITLSATANQAITTWQYRLNGGSRTTFTPGQTITAVSGANTIIVYGTNANGEGSASTSFTVTLPVTPTPTITIVSPVSGTTYNSTSILLNATSDQIVTWTYSLNGNSNTSFIPGTTTLNLGNGTFNLVIYGTNANGMGSSSVNFVINTSLNGTIVPIISAISPTNGATYTITSGSSYNLVLNATSNQAVTWTYSLNGGTNTSFVPGTTSLNFGTGTYNITFYGTNVNGTGSATASFTITTGGSGGSSNEDDYSSSSSERSSIRAERIVSSRATDSTMDDTSTINLGSRSTEERYRFGVGFYVLLALILILIILILLALILKRN